jgi:hypothetical protein
MPIVSGIVGRRAKSNEMILPGQKASRQGREGL